MLLSYVVNGASHALDFYAKKINRKRKNEETRVQDRILYLESLDQAIDAYKDALEIAVELRQLIAKHAQNALKEVELSDDAPTVNVPHKTTDPLFYCWTFRDGANDPKKPEYVIPFIQSVVQREINRLDGAAIKNFQ